MSKVQSPKFNLRSLKEMLSEILDTPDDTVICLWFSGGADSRLLLEVMLEVKTKPFGILRFDDGWTREQKKAVDAVILKHNLMVFSYPPMFGFLFGDDRAVSYAAGYAVGAGNHTVLIRDLVDDPKRCAFDIRISKAMNAIAPIVFDRHVVGSRFEDTHYAVDKLLKGEKWKVGDKEFFAPLAHWKRSDVVRELREYGIDWEQSPDALDTGNLPACHECLKSNGSGEVFCPKENRKIPIVKWDASGNLRSLQKMLERTEKNNAIKWTKI